MRNSNFFGAPSPGGQSVREITSREETERPPENRLGRSQHAPACPRNRKPAGDLARQIEPLPSRSRRHLDYESSGSPSQQILKQIRRGVHRSVRELEVAIREFIAAHNETPKPFVWAKTADQILASIAR